MQRWLVEDTSQQNKYTEIKGAMRKPNHRYIAHLQINHSRFVPEVNYVCRLKKLQATSTPAALPAK